MKFIKSDGITLIEDLNFIRFTMDWKRYIAPTGILSEFSFFLQSFRRAAAF
jgi:hypothetical protein